MDIISFYLYDNAFIIVHAHYAFVLMIMFFKLFIDIASLYLRQCFSSLASPQSLSPSQTHDSSIHLELWHVYWEGSQVLASEKHEKKMITWHGNAFCFLHYWPFVRGIHQELVDSPHKGSVFNCYYGKVHRCWPLKNTRKRRHYDMEMLSTLLVLREGNHKELVDSPHKGPVYRALMVTMGRFTGASLWKTQGKGRHYDMEKALAPHYWPFVRGLDLELVNSPHKGSVLTVTTGRFTGVNLWKNTRKKMISWEGNALHITGPFVRGIHQEPVDSPHKGSVYRDLTATMRRLTEASLWKKNKEKDDNMTRKWFPHICPFMRGTTGDQWIPFTKGQ